LKISEERPWVVLVDDEAEVLSALLRCLRNEPYEVLTTCLPERALRWVHCFDVAAVVSDQRMPGLAGTEFLDRVSSSSPFTARILLTAYPSDPAMVSGLRRSAQCMIAKPWDEFLLRRTLKDFVSGHASAAAGGGR
jgi:response regulator RpfG family c-di-GMP phosphodiesterase